VNLDPLAETSTDLLIRHPCKLTGDSAGSKKTSGAARTRCDGAPTPTHVRLDLHLLFQMWRIAIARTARTPHMQIPHPVLAAVVISVLDFAVRVAIAELLLGILAVAVVIVRTVYLPVVMGTGVLCAARHVRRQHGLRVRCGAETERQHDRQRDSGEEPDGPLP